MLKWECLQNLGLPTNFYAYKKYIHANLVNIYA